MSVRVSELPDEFVALAQVAELNPDAQYIFRIEKNLSCEQADYMHQYLESRGVRNSLLVHGTDIKVYKIERD